MEALVAAIILVQQPLARACMPRKEWLESVQHEYGEKLAWQGISNSGVSLFLMTLNRETGDWSFAEQTPDGMVCIRAGGHQHAVEPKEWL